MAVAKLLQGPRCSQTGQPSTASEAQQCILDDIVEVVSGTKNFKADSDSLLGEESVAGGAQVCLRSRPLPCALTQRARHAKGGAERVHETSVSRRDFAPDLVIEMENTKARSH